ncbi:MAG: hypothetical protein LBT23_12325, partial [Synergistaceae bacterium]|nr:hypothetical protein [Synergistaceae bacterium]
TKTLLFTYEVHDAVAAEASTSAAANNNDDLSFSNGDTNFGKVIMRDFDPSVPPTITSNDGVIIYWLRNNL